ncbi:MAG: ribose 5-phosphate isomerase B [Phycisphaerales bacterium]|nr:ribose 5-phosphate isomerase B [Phycisphaerales bacterium]
MRIALGADHRGVVTASQLAERLRREGHEAVLSIPGSGETCDYPEPAYVVAQRVAGGEADRGVLICGTGIGMSIAANKVHGVRAAVVHDELTAQLCRTHNDANIICLSGDLLGQRLIEQVVEIFLTSEFEGGRHARRVHKIAAIERGEDPAALPEHA